LAGGTETFTLGSLYGDMKDVLYSVRRCILEYLGLEVMEPFVAYAAPRVRAFPEKAESGIPMPARI
jgi:NAD(P)H dehydrogenase (quinone)